MQAFDSCLLFRLHGQRITLMFLLKLWFVGPKAFLLKQQRPQVRKAFARGAETGRYFSHQLMRFYCVTMIMTLHRPSILLTVAFQLLFLFLDSLYFFMFYFIFYFTLKTIPLANKTRWKSPLFPPVGTPVATPHVRVSELLASIVT